jgi:hypothetical protein
LNKKSQIAPSKGSAWDLYRLIVRRSERIEKVPAVPMQGGPACREFDGVLDPGGVPAILAVGVEEELPGESRLLIEFGRDVLRS